MKHVFLCCENPCLPPLRVKLPHIYKHRSHVSMLANVCTVRTVGIIYITISYCKFLHSLDGEKEGFCPAFSLTVGDACLSDSECAPSFKCCPPFFLLVGFGGYCTMSEECELK